MKKIAILTSVLALASCGAYHTGKIGATISGPDVQFTPQEAKLAINTQNKISGSATCSSLLWVFNDVPERQVYGAKLQTKDGVMASSDCVAGAVYDAMSKTDADLIVAPQYTTVRDGVLCFGYRCLFGTTKVLVKGFSGKITTINDMDRSVVQEKLKQGKSEESVLGGLF